MATERSKRAKRQEKTQESGRQGGSRTLNLSLCNFSGPFGKMRSMKAGGLKSEIPQQL